MAATPPPTYSVDDAVADQRTHELRSFWAQAVFTTLLLGHGAAFLAILSGFLGSDDRGTLLPLVRWRAAFFGTGICLSYLVSVCGLLEAVGITIARRAII